MRLWVALAAIFLIYGAVILRLGQLQLVLHGSLKAKSASEFVKQEKVRPLRSRVLDRRGRTLAMTVERPSLFVFPKQLKVSRLAAARLISKVLPGLGTGELTAQNKKSANFIWIKRLADLKEGEIFGRLRLKGIGVQMEPKRYRPFGSIAAEVIGTVNLDGRGAAGLERKLEPLLEGEEIVRVVLHDALGKVFEEEDSYVAGYLKGLAGRRGGPFDVYLTLDAELNDRMETELESALIRHEAERAMAVVLDVKTGAILAMASRRRQSAPSGAGSDLDPNFAVSYTFEPGSVIKPFVLASALSHGAVKESDVFNCENGRWRISSDFFIEDHEPYQDLRLNEVLAYSSNIGFAKIGMKTGADNVYLTYRAFGFASRTGLPVTGEAVGILRPTDQWGSVSLAMVSFGYEIGVTLIQLAQAFAALANGGVLLEPQIVERMAPYRTAAPAYQMSSRKVRRVVSPEIAKQVLALMEEAVLYGTGKAARIDDYRVAGKTGTAQKIDPKTGKYSPRSVMVSFCGILPLPDPDLVICAVLDDPKKPKVAWASDLAAPLFKSIAQDALIIFGIPPSRTPPPSQALGEKI